MQSQVGRRSFLRGLGLIVAAPAIVKVESLMKLPPKQLIRPAPLAGRPRIVIGQLRPGVYGLLVSSSEDLVIDFTNKTMTIKGDLVEDGTVVAKNFKVAHRLTS